MESLGGTPIEAEHCIIRCDREPVVPKGLVIVSHVPGEDILWDKSAQGRALWVSEGQKASRSCEGGSIREELLRLKKPVLNACVLDYLCAYPDARPDGWWQFFVLFWGTIYKDIHSRCECVRYLCSDNGNPYSGTMRLDAPLNRFDPAALRAN